MAQYKVTLPAMGEGIIEATITRWLVSKGDPVKVDQPLLEIATDKVDSEIPSPVEGTVFKLVYNEGEVPKVGGVIAIIETNGSGNMLHEELASPSNGQKSGMRSPVAEEKSVETSGLLSEEEISLESETKHTENVFLSPLIRMLAGQRGLSTAELMQIRGTGLAGRITRDDLNNYLINRKITNKETHLEEIPAVAASLNKHTDIPFMADEDDEMIEMDRMRKLIAGHMSNSKKIAPHVTSFLEADVTGLVEWRERNKERFYAQSQVKLTYTPLFVEATARALKEFPRINVSLAGDQIVLHKHINIGVATALPDGNLIVPVIRNADQENLEGLARIIADLASRARSNALLPAEIRGGTFTITNIGQYNNLTGTPIINQPQSAILAIGTIARKPWVVNTPQGQGIAVREISMLSLTYDHRIVDGALGGSFLSRVVWHLENFDLGRTR
jgi:2-oxoglutarate dehydrogenase E2 component (dihydrolipoamide succinyltransferase)